MSSIRLLELPARGLLDRRCLGTERCQRAIRSQSRPARRNVLLSNGRRVTALHRAPSNRLELGAIQVDGPGIYPPIPALLQEGIARSGLRAAGVRRHGAGDYSALLVPISPPRLARIRRTSLPSRKRPDRVLLQLRSRKVHNQRLLSTGRPDNRLRSVRANRSFRLLPMEVPGLPAPRLRTPPSLADSVRGRSQIRHDQE